MELQGLAPWLVVGDVSKGPKRHTGDVLVASMADSRKYLSLVLADRLLETQRKLGIGRDDTSNSEFALLSSLKTDLLVGR